MAGTFSAAPGEGFLRWLQESWGRSNQNNEAIRSLLAAGSAQDLDIRWQKIPPDIQAVQAVRETYQACKNALESGIPLLADPLSKFIQQALHKWKESTGDLKGVDPENAEKKLAQMTASAIEVIAAATLIDLGLGAIPTTTEGVVSSNATRHLMTSLGVGAVIAAFSHDPVKVALLRPYQDNLEATYRNRRPDDFALFQAYRTRELAPEIVDDARELTDEAMVRIETENDRIYDKEIMYWGYSEEFARSLARSATSTPTFGNLMALARIGLLDRGLAMYSLWGQGMDKVTMPALLDGLEQMNIISNYQGFRSMIEPSYTSGDIDEADLVEYWDRIRVPKDLQTWVLPRLRKSREKALAAKTATVKERDLTVSQIQDAYIQNLIDRGTAYSWLAALTPKYEPWEIDILLNLADTRRKIPGVAKLKRLPLSDYEKAFKNKIRTKQDVLERMQGEYDPRDIALEAALIDIGKE
jgi:hypothetical protein